MKTELVLHESVAVKKHMDLTCACFLLLFFLTTPGIFPVTEYVAKTHKHP